MQEAPDTASYAESGLPSQLKLEQMLAGMYQPRKRMDEGALYKLAESMRAQGVMQPILVRRVEEALSDLLMGEVEACVKQRAKRQGRVQEMGELSNHFGSLDERNGSIEKCRA